MVAFRPVRRLAIFSITLVIAILFLGIRHANAGPAEAQSFLAEAERADQAFELAKALEGYEAALREDPTMSKALLAEQRAKTLRSHSEGDFAPLVMLERVRRDPALGSSAQAIDDLAGAAKTFPPGLVRVEARVLVAEAYATRLGRIDEAAELWRVIATDEKAEPVVRRAALRSLATFYLSRGRDADAIAVLDLDRDPKDEQLAKVVRRGARRHKLHLASIAAIAIVVILAAVALVRARRNGRLAAVLGSARRSAKLIVGYAAYTAIAGALLASGYEAGTSRPFVLFGIALVPLLLIARAWGAAGSAARSSRSARAALCALSTVAVAFLVLESVDVTYLEGLGL